MENMILKVLGAALLCMPLMAGVCRAAEESVTPQGQASENKEDTTPGTSPVAETGKLPPLAAMITSPFGLRRMPGWLSRRGMVMREHSGLDIRARLGWPVVAFEGGPVIRGRNGRPARMGDLKALENYSPPSLPAWGQGQ